MPTKPRSFHHLSQRQDGVSLVVVLLLLIIVSMLGVASMQIATMGERGARNEPATAADTSIGQILSVIASIMSVIGSALLAKDATTA